MKLDAGEIKDLVTDTERKRQNWVEAAEIWETAYFLNRYEDTRQEKRELDGVDVVVSPDPFNVIQLLQRFVAHEMRIEVPNLTAKDDDGLRSQTVEEWLLTFDIISNRQQGVNHVNDMTWQSGVLGRGAAQVLWIGDVIPKGTSTDKLLPIWRRTLDPRNVGVARGPYWTDYAYHKYKTTRADIEQRYPKYKLPEFHGREVRQGYWNEKYTVIDFWCRHKGAIWHSVVIDDKFAITPKETDYPDIPIIEWYADGAPVADELGRSLSILHPILELWKMKCDLMGKVATGLMYHYDPVVIFKGFNADQKVEFGPGANIFIGENQSVDAFRPEPNVPMAQAMLAMLQTGIDQATFPGVTYGDAPGGVNAGFAINNLAQQAQARAGTIRQNIEGACELENQLSLSLVEAFAPEDGVEIYKRNSRGERGGPLLLNKKIIKGNYDNQVRLLPERPMDDTQKILAWSGLAEKRLISDGFFRDEGLNVQMPRDEETRIAAENALKSPEMQLKVQLRALQKMYKQEDWELMIVGTPLDQLHQQEQQWREQKRQEEEAAKAQRQEEKRLREMQEAMANMPILPPNMPLSLPNMGPNMNGLTMTPPIPTGHPIGTPNSGMMSGPGMQPPGLPGVPPQMAGQMTPDALGIPPGAPPGMFDQLMGGAPPTDEELLRSMGGIPPQF